MASKLIGIVGQTGTGKSTSIKHLDPKETYIINVAKKELPFKGADKLYNVENKNYKEVDDAVEMHGRPGTGARGPLTWRSGAVPGAAQPASAGAVRPSATATPACKPRRPH